MEKKLSICWFRRDLRLYDNAALYHALKGGHSVIALFIYDKIILDKLDNKQDARLTFIYDQITEMHQKLKSLGSSMLVYYDDPISAFEQILKTYNIEAVYTNEDYEPYATERDGYIKKLLSDHQIDFHSYKDQVIFSKEEIVKADGNPYQVFTPYSKAWLNKLNDFYKQSYPVKKYSGNFYQTNKALKPLPTLQDIGFERSGQYIPPCKVDETLIKNYAAQRDYPAKENTSRLGIHLRFGTISIRELIRESEKHSRTFVSELIWRDFYQSILWHYPKVGKGHAFRAAYDTIEWEHNDDHFQAWCDGRTGYPLVDAGMRQLNATGFMHNRIRMVTASFLAKHLLLDWRLGEAYFAEKLLDYDLAANNGGWQWSSGSGVDAAPYFRVFNPELQAKKFDPANTYIRQWVPEFDTPEYPQPIVEHKFARERAIGKYKQALTGNN